MDQLDSETENEEASFQSNKDNDNIKEYVEGEGKTEEEEYIGEEQDRYS